MLFAQFRLIYKQCKHQTTQTHEKGERARQSDIAFQMLQAQDAAVQSMIAITAMTITRCVLSTIDCVHLKKVIITALMFHLAADLYADLSYL